MYEESKSQAQRLAPGSNLREWSYRSSPVGNLNTKTSVEKKLNSTSLIYVLEKVKSVSNITSFIKKKCRQENHLGTEKTLFRRMKCLEGLENFTPVIEPWRILKLEFIK